MHPLYKYPLYIHHPSLNISFLHIPSLKIPLLYTLFVHLPFLHIEPWPLNNEICLLCKLRVLPYKLGICYLTGRCLASVLALLNKNIRTGVAYSA